MLLFRDWELGSREPERKKVNWGAGKQGAFL